MNFNLLRPLLGLCFLLSACGPKGPDLSGGNDGSYDLGNSTDITDTRSCQTAPYAGDSIQGTWQKVFQNAGGTFVLTQYINLEGNAEFTNTCHVGGTTISVSVRVPVTVTPTTITYEMADEQRAELNGVTCRIRVPRETVVYRMSGGCLDVAAGSIRGPWVRASY